MADPPKTDFSSISSLLKKTAEESRKAQPDRPAATAGSEAEQYAGSELPLPPPAETDTFVPFGSEELPDEPIIALPDSAPDPRREAVLRALRVVGIALGVGALLGLVLWLVFKPQSLEKQYAYGAQLIADGKDAEAEALYTKLVTENSPDARLAAAYARAYFRRGDMVPAQQKLAAGLAVEATGRDLLELQGELGLQTGELDRAAAAAAVLRREYHDELAGYVLQADVEMRRGNWDEAIAQLRQAGWYSENNPVLYRRLRRAHLRAGDIAAAQAANRVLVDQNAVAVDEYDYLDLIALQLALDNWYLAGEYARLGRQRFPASYELQAMSVRVAISARRFSEAEAEARELIAQRPQDPAGYFFLGEAAYALGDMGTALRHLQEAATIDPQYGPALARLGDIALFHLRQEEPALAYYRRAETTGFSAADFWFGYGLALWRRGDHAAAAARWEKARLLQPRSLPVAYNLATAYLLTARADSAAVLYAQCAGLEEVQGRLQNNLGVIAELRGDTRTAAKQYLAAQEAAGLPVAAENLARFFRGEPLRAVATAAATTVLEAEPGRERRGG